MTSNRKRSNGSLCFIVVDRQMACFNITDSHLQNKLSYSVEYICWIHKYSTDQKQAAVQYYLDHDRCIAGTLIALGYPCRATLVGLIEELQPGIRQRVVGRAPNVQHPQEFKNAAVIELCTRKTSDQAISQKLEVCRPTLYNWKNQLLGPKVPRAETYALVNNLSKKLRC